MTPYQTRVLADGASNYWPFDDPEASATVRDAAGAAPGLPFAPITFGLPGPAPGAATCAYFDGENGNPFVLVRDLLALPIDATLEAWFRVPPGVSYGNQLIFSNRWDASPDCTLFGTEGTDVRPYAGQSSQVVRDATSRADDRWHHVVATFDGTNSHLRLFVDGLAVAVDETLTRTAQTSIASTLGGNDNLVNDFWIGYLADVALYPSVLADTTIVAHFELYRPPPKVFPLSGVAAYWALDEASGPRFDRHGAMHLAEHNGVGAAPGLILGAAHFQQVNSQYLARFSETPLETGNIDFTLSAWINPSVISACVVVGKDAVTGRDYALELTAEGLARFSCSRNQGAAFVEAPDPIFAGVWSLLVAWHDAAAKTISIQVNNGPETAASTKNVPPNVTGAEFRIGSRQGAAIADYFDGDVDEVGLWKRTLTADERAALWNDGAGKTYPPPLIAAPPPPLVAALRERLLMLPDVFEKVGTRIYTLMFPQSLTAPALRLQEIDRVSAMHLRGVVEIVRARVQVDCVEAQHHGDPYTRAHALALAVRGSVESGAASGLAGFRGDLSGIAVSGILADDQRERYDAEARMVRIEQDFIVWFTV